jgi:putative polyhydroxyalkanoate system protein
MPKVEMTRSHSLDDSSARAKIDELTAGLKTRFNAALEWRNDKELTIKGSGFSGKVTLEPGQVRLLLELSLLMSPFKGAAEDHMKKALDKAFG